MLNKNKKKTSKKRDFEDLERLMVDALNQFFYNMPDLDELLRNKPLALGFAIKFDSKGKPRIKVYSSERKAHKRKHRRHMKALVDVVHYKDSVLVTALLPGCLEKDIDVKVTPRSVIISSASERFKFYKEVPIRANIIPESAEKRFKNGVLEVAIKKATSI